MKHSIHIVQLYPKDMNIYGDYGNVLTLVRRLERYGYQPVVTEYNVGDTFPDTVDIVVGGGGQDSGQSVIKDDLIALGPTLRQLAEDGVPMLVVCGLYQLFGHFFETADGVRIPGISIFDIETKGSSERLIGNIVTNSDEFGDIVGYENHSGQTTLANTVTPLGMVIKGAGNNATGTTEGCRVHNVIGTYLHGSLLPKNPAIADFLIRTALSRRGISFDHAPLNDTLANNARQVALSRPR